METYNEKDKALIDDMCPSELAEFEKWFAKLNKVAGDKYGPKSLKEETGVFCWLDAFTHGQSPKEAVEQDMREGFFEPHEW